MRWCKDSSIITSLVEGENTFGMNAKFSLAAWKEMYEMVTAKVKNDSSENIALIDVVLAQPPPLTSHWKPTAMDIRLNATCEIKHMLQQALI